MDNKEFMTKVLDAHGLTNVPVLHDGTWMYAAEFRAPLKGEFAWLSQQIQKMFMDYKSTPHIIYKPCALPPRPTPERVAELEKEGWRVNDVPDLESVPFISHDMSEIIPEGDDGRCFDIFHGLRYGLTKIVKVEPVVEYRKCCDGYAKLVDKALVAYFANAMSEQLVEPPVVDHGWYMEDTQAATAAEYLAAKVKPEAVKTFGNCASSEDIGEMHRVKCVPISASVSSGACCGSWVSKPPPKPLTLADVPLGAIAVVDGHGEAIVTRHRTNFTDFGGHPLHAEMPIQSWRWPNGGGK